ncbi:IPT/TIG domain-containing protein [Pycnococcus provasolii]
MRSFTHAGVVALALVALATTVRLADATHFRYGALYWEPDLEDTNNRLNLLNYNKWLERFQTNPQNMQWKVNFYASFTFRRNYFWGAYFNEQWRPSFPPGTASERMADNKMRSEWRSSTTNQLNQGYECSASSEMNDGILCFLKDKFGYFPSTDTTSGTVEQSGRFGSSADGQNGASTYNYQLKFPVGFHNTGQQLRPNANPKVCTSYLHKGVNGDPSWPTCEYPNTDENMELIARHSPDLNACVKEFDGTAASWVGRSPQTDPPNQASVIDVNNPRGISVCTPWNEVFGFFFGDTINTNSLEDHELVVDVVDLDTEDTMLGNTVRVRTKTPRGHTYQGSGPENKGEGFVAFFTGGNRISNMNNNGDGRYRLETLVKLDTYRPLNRSPIGSNIPVLPLPYDSTPGNDGVNFQIAAFDPDEYDQVRYFLANVEEMGALKANAANEVVTLGGGNSYIKPEFTWYADYYHYANCDLKRMDPAVCADMRELRSDNTSTVAFINYNQDAPLNLQAKRWDPKVNYQRQPVDYQGNTINLDARSGIATWKTGKPTPNSPDPFVNAVKPGFYNLVVMIEEIHAEPTMTTEQGCGSDAVYNTCAAQLSTVYNSLINDPLSRAGAGPAHTCCERYPLGWNNPNVVATDSQVRDDAAASDKKRIGNRVKVPLDFMLFVYPHMHYCRGDCLDVNAYGANAPFLKTFATDEGIYGETKGKLNKKCKVCGGGGTYVNYLGATLNSFPVVDYGNGYGIGNRGTTYCNTTKDQTSNVTTEWGVGECKGDGDNAESIVPRTAACEINTRPFFLTRETTPQGTTPSLGVPSTCIDPNTKKVSANCADCLAPDKNRAPYTGEGTTDSKCIISKGEENDLLAKRNIHHALVYEGMFMPGVFNCVRGMDCFFDLVAYDNDDCSDLVIGTTGLYDTMLLTPQLCWRGEQGSNALVSQGDCWRHTAADGSQREAQVRRFLWPAARCTSNCTLDAIAYDDRPANSLVCFFVSDRYLVTVYPFHCININIEEQGKLRWCDYDNVGNQPSRTAYPNQVFRAYLGEEMCVPLCIEKAIQRNSDGNIDIRKVRYERPDGERQRDGKVFRGWPHPLPYEEKSPQGWPYSKYTNTFQFPYDEINFPPETSTRDVVVSEDMDPLEKRYCFTPNVGEECVYTACFQGYDKDTVFTNDYEEDFLVVTEVRCVKIEVYNAVMEFDGTEQATDRELSKYVVPMKGMTMAVWVYPRCAGVEVDTVTKAYKETNMTVIAFTSVRDLPFGAVRTEAPTYHKGQDEGMQVRNAIMFNAKPDKTTGALVSTFFYYDHYAGDVFATGQYLCDKWHYVAVTIDTDDSATLFVDGVSPAHAPVSTARDDALFDAVSFKTASRPDNNMDGDDKGLFRVGHLAPYVPGQGFTGFIDDIAVWNRALTPLQVEAHRMARIASPSEIPAPTEIRTAYPPSFLYADALLVKDLVGYYTVRARVPFPMKSNAFPGTLLESTVGTPTVADKAIPTITPCVLGIQHAVAPVDGDCTMDVYGWNFADGVSGACSFGDLSARMYYKSETISACTTPPASSVRFISVKASNDAYNFTAVESVNKTVRQLLMDSALHVTGLGGGAAADSVCEDLAGRGFSMTAWVCPKCGPPAPPPPPPASPPPPNPPIFLPAT